MSGETTFNCGTERFSAKMYVDYYLAHKGIALSDIGVAPTVVLSWGQGVIEELAAAVQATRCHNWFYDEGHIVYPLYRAYVNNQPVSLVQCPEGAPATIMMMEELIACGAEVFVGLGWAGALQQTVSIGTIILPTDCVSEEGTSRHYVSSARSFCADRALAEILTTAGKCEGVEIVLGTQWTTDAPYRELIESVERYRHQGVLGVDMETSAMYSVASFRGVRACNLLVISDELWGEWRPAFRSTEVKLATELAQRIVLRSLAALSGTPFDTSASDQDEGCR